ncbi:hypothetical protein NPIL_246381 [Nephila pilipes]|uniref:Uncharacterized protein n=1 Tax=Nephila pilipes TaxID=299642 RepID=A0A8X6U5I2_NEPPI|nr:hypothetical protein NPIL_246381 [Nephila pilipes]
MESDLNKALLPCMVRNQLEVENCDEEDLIRVLYLQKNFSLEPHEKFLPSEEELDCSEVNGELAPGSDKAPKTGWLEFERLRRISFWKKGETTRRRVSMCERAIQKL